MKRYVLLIGGAGARMADALLCAASAGVFPAETLQILLADPDRRGSRGAGMVAARMADYARVQQVLQGEGGFSAEMRFQAWPEKLPMDASTLSQWTGASEADALLCQALFDQEAASLDLREGCHGRSVLGQVTFAGLLHQAKADPDDVLSRMIAGMNEACDAGEEVRVVLTGSVCGGTGAAGVSALAAHIREQTGDRVRMAAVLTAACIEQENAVSARETIARYAREGLCGTICLLGLPHSCCASAPAEYARLTDWLAVYCMDVLLHRESWLSGLFTVRAEDGPASWSMFGKAAERYHLAYGRLVKAASAWTYAIGPMVERRLQHPFFLRDKMLGWYAHFFRKTEGGRDVQLEDAACLTRLMRVVLLWLGGVCKTLPLDMRHHSVLQDVRGESRAHYDGLTELVSQLSVLDDDAQRNELYEESLVHRKYTEEETEAEIAMRRIDAVKQEVSRRSASQVALNRRMGGASAMEMLEDALETAQQESNGLRGRIAEAYRRIDHAESIAAEEDQYRILDARTKMQRMERHQVMLDSRVERIRGDLAAAAAEGLRFDRPAMSPAAPESAMFLPDMTERLLQREMIARKQLEAMWPHLVLPRDGMTLKMTLKRARRHAVRRDAPVISLLQALMIHSMEEV